MLHPLCVFTFLLAPALAEEAAAQAQPPEKVDIEVLVIREDEDLANIDRSDRIGTVVLTGGHVTDDALGHLAGASVRTLSIEGTRITNLGLRHLKSIKGLQSLRLWGGQFDDRAIKPIRAVPNLRSLDVDGTRIDGALLAALKNRSELRSLVLGQEIQDGDLQHLAGLPALEELDLRSCRRLTEACLAPLSGLSHLQTIWLPSHLPKKIRRALHEKLPECSVR